MQARAECRRVRALFISDVHLGMRSARVNALLSLLGSIEAETIYLVGDIIDGWKLRKSWYWPASHNNLVQAVLARGRAGTRIVYLPGNHDEFLRDHFETPFGDVEIADRVIHEAADGRNYLVLHGDQFDVVVRHAKWLAHMGDWAYGAAMRANVVINWVRRRAGLPYWSLSQWAKHNVKNAASYVGRFEQVLATEARAAGADGVICGHIHHATISEIDGIRYLNCGDWVESCTAIIEDRDGQFELVHYYHTQEPRRQNARRTAERLRRLISPPT